MSRQSKKKAAKKVAKKAAKKKVKKMTSSVVLSSQVSQKDLSKIRSSIRESFIRSDYKKAYLDKFKQLIPRETASGKLHKVPWVKYQCECCEELFKAEDINVDHIENVGAFKTVDDIHDFFFRIWCSYDNLQVLCVQCHDDKTAQERSSAALARKKGKVVYEADIVGMPPTGDVLTKLLESDLPINIKASAVERVLFPPIVLSADQAKLKDSPEILVDVAATDVPGMDAYVDPLDLMFATPIPDKTFAVVTKEVVAAGVKRMTEELLDPPTDHELAGLSIVNLKMTYLGLPLSSDTLYSEGELVFDLKNGATVFCNFGDEMGDENPETYIMHKLSKLISSGKIVTGIHCHSAEDLQIQTLAVPENFEYPVETAEEIKPLDLSSLI